MGVAAVPQAQEQDLRERPRYTYREVARAADVPPSTVGAWVRGYPYGVKRGGGSFKPVIRLPDPHDPRLSFNNLLEIAVLRALRTTHEIDLRHIRQALAISQHEFGIKRLLISPELRAGAGRLFLQQYGRLLELSPARQLAMETILGQFLERVNFDQARFFPIERSPQGKGSKLILVTPFVSFGRPIVSRVGVSTQVIAERLNAGEKREAIIRDYGLNEPEFDEALLYEAAA
jgi:uncharacterized protein (DUF433 family)/transposase-like protein